MEILQIITFIGLSLQTRIVFAMNCQEQMNYHEKYSYGYDISCSNLNEMNIDELRNITVYNEVRLTIEKSDLSHLTADLFENLSKIREIIIIQSKMDLKKNSSLSPFENLQQLAVLSVTHSNISELSKDFLKGLDNLRLLNVSNNNLSLIERETLKSVEDLDELDLSANNFQQLHKIPLCEVQQLRRLFLQNNHLTSLKNSSFECLKILKTLILDFNNIIELVSLSQLRYLVHVSLSHNKIEDLSGTFGSLGNLQQLNLEGNKLKVIRDSYFKGALMLRRLNLKNNSINLILPEAFCNLSYLEELNLENNNLSKLPVFQLKSLKKLFLSNNDVSIENGELRNLHALEFLSLKHCNILKITKTHFQYLNFLQTLDLSYNNVILTSNSFYGLHTLTVLYLKSNSLLSLLDYAFQFVANLEILDLSDNKLKQLTNLTFHNLKNLETLNLSYNHLETLAENVLLPLKNLKTLDLEGNRLKYIDYDIIISLLSNLKLFNIRENQLSCQFLTEMLRYFNNKKINFTISEKLSYEKENVAGISCREYDKYNESFKHTDEILDNDTKVLNEIYNMAKDDNKNLNESLNTTLLVLGSVILLLFISVTGVSYRMYLIIKRRSYVSDEIELLDTRLTKCNNYR